MLSKKILNSYVLENGPIKIAVAGAGYIAKGLFNQISLISGVEVTAIMSKTPEKVKYLVNILPEQDIKIVNNIEDLIDTDADLIVDLTGDVELGAQIAELTINNNKHILVNTETDATVGPVLAEMAREKNVMYTNMWGDEPGLTKSLYDYADVLGFEIIAIGKFKKFHDPYANPDTVLPWAKQSNQNPVVIASFADGSKLSMEMAVISNATGLVPDVCGMHMPQGKFEDVNDLLKLKSEGGILNKKGVLEVIKGPEPSGGVFALIRTENEDIIKSLQYYKQGDGPNYMLYIPYHMPGIEILYGIIENFILNKSVIEPQTKPVSDAIAFAKRDLEVGMTLEDIGGFDYFGKVEVAQKAKAQNALPLGMAPDAKVLRAVKKGELITMADVEIQNHETCARLRERYNELVD